MKQKHYEEVFPSQVVLNSVELGLMAMSCFGWGVSSSTN